MKQWARKYDKCVRCDRTKFKHKGHGLCTSCFDKERLKKPKRKQQIRNQQLKYYLKHKDTEEFKIKQKDRGEKYRSGEKYRYYLQKAYARRRVNRFIKTGWKTHIKKTEKTISVVINGRQYKSTVKFTDGMKELSVLGFYELNYFKKKKLEQLTQEEQKRQ